MGLFKPAWMSKDNVKAEKAVAKINDQTTLARVARESQFWNVRLAAVRKLTDHKYLSAIVNEEHDERVRTAAADKLAGNAPLQNYAAGSTSGAPPQMNPRSNRHDRKNAIRDITDQNTLAEIVLNGDFSMRKEAVKKLTDQEMLVKVAQSMNAVDVRLIAIRKLDDQETLTRIAEKDKDHNVRVSAARRLSDRTLAQRVFTNIAKNSADHKARLAAAKELTDKALAQEVLYSIVKSKAPADIRQEALKHISNQTRLQKESADVARDAKQAKELRDAVKQATAQAGTMMGFAGGNTSAAVSSSGKPHSILDQYQMGLSYLDECGIFDEAKFHIFNRIIGNKFSAADIETQLGNAQLIIGGMESLKQILRSNMVEAINTFKEIERSGIDLSKFNL